MSVGGQGGAVDRDDRPLAAAAAVVEGAGDEVLAGARLAEEEDGRVGRGHLLDLAAARGRGRRCGRRSSRSRARAAPPVQDHVLGLESVAELPDLAEGPLERTLRPLELRDVGVHDEGARLLVEGHGVDAGGGARRRARGARRSPRTRAAPVDHRADPVDDAARAGVRRRHPGERGQVVASRRRPRPGEVRRQAAAGRSFIETSRPSPSSTHDLARERAEDRAVQPLGGRDALLGAVAVEGLRRRRSPAAPGATGTRATRRERP